jgi:hypothetical protein
LRNGEHHLFRQFYFGFELPDTIRGSPCKTTFVGLSLAAIFSTVQCSAILTVEFES